MGRRVETPAERRKKLYLVIGLSAVLCVSAYFRFFHQKGTGAEAGASPATATSSAPVPRPVAANETTRGATNETARIEEQLRREVARMVGRDIFEPGRAAVKGEAKTGPVGDGPPREVSFVLSGMISNGDQPVAIVNGELRRTGDRIEGYEVARIGAKEVFLKGGGREIVLRISENGQK